MSFQEYFKQLEEKHSKMRLTKEDVWGHEKTNGMVIASSNEKCPIFEDIVPHKSVTVVCELEQEEEVRYWLNYVLGGGCVSNTCKVIQGNTEKVAIRANYKCW